MAKLSLETWRQVPIITKKSKHQNYQMAQIILFIPVKAEIRGDFKGDPEIFQLGAFANFKGRAVFKKIDANANPLPGTIFKLYESKTGKNL